MPPEAGKCDKHTNFAAQNIPAKPAPHNFALNPNTRITPTTSPLEGACYVASGVRKRPGKIKKPSPNTPLSSRREEGKVKFVQV